MTQRSLSFCGRLGIVRVLLLLFLVIGEFSSVIVAQNCATSTSIPAGQKKLGTGSATVHYDSTTAIKGGQSVYVKIKNQNVLGVSYTVTIAEDATPAAPNCSYHAVLLPQQNALLSGAVFADPPIGWKVTVAVGDESDAGVLTYEVYSEPQKDRSR